MFNSRPLYCSLVNKDILDLPNRTSSSLQAELDDSINQKKQERTKLSTEIIILVENKFKIFIIKILMWSEKNVKHSLWECCDVVT